MARVGLAGEGRPRRSSSTAYIASTAWRKRRALAIEAAGGRCQVCNSPDNLDAHHRTYARFGHELPGDLTVLCSTCHQLFHGRLRANDGRRRQSDAWADLLGWAVGELRSAVHTACLGLGLEHEMTGRHGALLREALRSEDLVMKRIFAAQDRQARRDN